MISLDYFLLGYFNIGVEEKQKASVLELFLQKGITARFSNKNGLTVKQKYRKKVLEALSDTQIQISKNKGLPDFFYQNRRKYGVFFGIFICLVCFFLCSGRIWDIRVCGASNEESEQVVSVYLLLCTKLKREITATRMAILIKTVDQRFFGFLSSPSGFLGGSVCLGSIFFLLEAFVQHIISHFSHACNE